MTRMPVCFFFTRYQLCTNKECTFLHVDPNSTIAECSWYERGFCRHGGNCRKKHTRQFPCYRYLCGFCPEGPNCKWVHMKFDIPETKNMQNTQESFKSDHPNSQQSNPAHNTSNGPPMQTGIKHVICNYCREPGHKIYTCTKIPAEKRDETIQNYVQNSKRYQANKTQMDTSGSNAGGDGSQQQNNISNPEQRYHKPLNQVTCFKCLQTGHFANKCPNGFNNYMKNQHNHNKNFNSNNNTNNHFNSQT